MIVNLSYVNFFWMFVIIMMGSEVYLDVICGNIIMWDKYCE